MRISATHLHTLLHVKHVIEHLKTMMEQQDGSLTDQECEALCESLERAYDRAEALLTPEVMQALADEDGKSRDTTTEKEDVHAAAGVRFP